MPLSAIDFSLVRRRLSKPPFQISFAVYRFSMDPSQARRRWFGVFFLTIAAGMLIWGQTILKPYLKDLYFLLYWLLCFLFTGLAIVTALLDVRALRKKTMEDQRQLIHRTLQETENKALESKDRTRFKDSNKASEDQLLQEAVKRSEKPASR